MKYSNLSFVIIGCFAIINLSMGCKKSGSAKPADNATTKVFDLKSSWDTTRVLRNPHKGWYHHYYDNGNANYMGNAADIEAMPGLDILFIRMAWSYLEPTEGNYDWHYIDELVAAYEPKGYRFGFAFTCKETHPSSSPVLGYATPKWVYDAGAKGTWVDCWGVNVVEPDYNDPIFLAKLTNFHNAVAARYKDKKWLAFIQVASYGTWGEGHNYPASDKVYPNAVIQKHIDIYKTAYNASTNLLCMPDDVYGRSWDKAPLKNYVDSKDIMWSDHSVNVNYYIQTFPASFSIQSPELFTTTYKNRPTQLELQHYGMTINEGNWTVPEGATKGARLIRGAVNTSHATWLGFHGDIKTYYKDNPNFCKEMANKLGYWYFMNDIKLPKNCKAGSTQRIDINWTNKGVAPAYHQYALLFKFTSGTEVVYASIDNSNNKLIQDGSSLLQNYSLLIPADITPGVKDVKIKLFDKSDTQRDVEIGLNASLKDADGYFKVGTVTVE